jgi:DNA-directed RNA polymerase specialized sigma24 family protein
MTLKALYQLTTGDLASHPRRIAAHFARLDARRQRLVRRRLDGASLHVIAAEEGITHGSVQSAIKGALEAIRKEIAGEPRYNRTGRTPRVKSPES